MTSKEDDDIKAIRPLVVSDHDLGSHRITGVSLRDNDAPRVLIVGDDRPTTRDIENRLRRRGMKVVMGGLPSSSIAAAIASLPKDFVDLSVAKPDIGYGDYRQFLPRKKQRW